MKVYRVEGLGLYEGIKALGQIHKVNSHNNDGNWGLGFWAFT